MWWGTLQFITCSWTPVLPLALLLVLTLALVPPLALLLALAVALQKTQSVTATQAFNRGRTRMPLPGGEGEVRQPSGPTYDFAKFSKKLHEIDPPMLKALFNCISTSTVFR